MRTLEELNYLATLCWAHAVCEHYRSTFRRYLVRARVGLAAEQRVRELLASPYASP